MIQSPCDKVRLVDDASGLCRGCGRSADEIARGTVHREYEPTRIMAQLPERLASVHSHRVRTTTS
jgi:predicted Fe-S protein YdhL (DUF1289 family)